MNTNIKFGLAAILAAGMVGVLAGQFLGHLLKTANTKRTNVVTVTNYVTEPSIPSIISASFEKAQTAETAKRIRDIKREYKRNADLTRSAIMSGYMACRMGVDLTNYLNQIDAQREIMMSNHIAEVLEP